MRTTLAAWATYARWAADNDIPVERASLLTAPMIARFVAAQRESGLAAGSLRNYLSRIELTSSHLLGQRLARDADAQPVDDAQEPLTPAQETDLWLWAHGLRTPTRRQRTQAVLALGLGCGLTRGEMLVVTPEDVTVAGDGAVTVSAVRTLTGEVRAVTCRADWEGRLGDLVAATPSGHCLLSPLQEKPYRPKTVDRLLRMPDEFPPPVPMVTQRLRNTWLVRMLDAGVPMQVLVSAAGLQDFTSLARLLPYLQAIQPDQAARLLRGAP